MVNVLNDFFISILTGLYNFLSFIVGILLGPVDILLRNIIPNYSDMITNINDFFDSLVGTVNWVISYLGFDDYIITFIKYELIFILTAPVAIVGIKLAVRWFNNLKVG